MTSNSFPHTQPGMATLHRLDNGRYQAQTSCVEVWGDKSSTLEHGRILGFFFARTGGRLMYSSVCVCVTNVSEPAFLGCKASLLQGARSMTARQRPQDELSIRWARVFSVPSNAVRCERDRCDTSPVCGRLELRLQVRERSSYTCWPESCR